MEFDDEDLHRYADRISSYYLRDVGGRLARHEFERQKREFLQSEWQHMINFCRDKLTYGLNEQTDVRDLRLRVPFLCLIVGKSQCGKTELLLTILRQWRYVTTDHDGVYTKRLYW